MITQEQKAEMAELRGSPKCMSYASIAELYGVTKQRVFAILNPGYNSKYQVTYRSHKKNKRKAEASADAKHVEL